MQIRVIPVVTENTFTTHNQDRAPSSAARYQPFGLNGTRLMTQSSSLVRNKTYLSTAERYQMYSPLGLYIHIQDIWQYARGSIILVSCDCRWIGPGRQAISDCQIYLVNVEDMQRTHVPAHRRLP